MCILPHSCYRHQTPRQSREKSDGKIQSSLIPKHRFSTISASRLFRRKHVISSVSSYGNESCFKNITTQLIRSPRIYSTGCRGVSTGRRFKWTTSWTANNNACKISTYADDSVLVDVPVGALRRDNPPVVSG